MGMNDYILVTPCKNEEESLPKLAESVINQTIRPKLWVIVDDGSTDRTPELLQGLAASQSWIKIIRLSEKPRDLGIHVAHVYRTGFDYAIEYCLNNEIEYGYIGSVDADIILDSNYFELLIHEFDINEDLGICSGHVGNIIDDEVVWSDFRVDLPSGGARLWLKKCFENTSGYLLTCSPDSVSNVKAKIKGWDTRVFDTAKAISTRPYSSAEGQWKGYEKLGANNYFIGYVPLHALLKGTKMLYSRTGYFKTGVGIAYICGYLSKYFKRAPRIEDNDILGYYRNNRLREILCSKLKYPTKAK